MKRIKKLFALLLAATLAASLLAVPAMGAEPAGHSYTYYVMMKVCESGPAEYFVEDEALADALAALKIDGTPVFSVEKAADEAVWYITACDGDFTPNEVAKALDGIKALASDSGALASDTLALGYGALVLIKTRAGTCLVSEITSASQNLFERPAPADKHDVSAVTLAITKIDEKPVTGDVISAEIGSQVTYTITVKVESGVQQVTLHHTLPNGLTMSATPTIKEGSLYPNSTWDSGSPTTNTINGDKTYTLSLNPSSTPVTCTITCTATVNENAKIAQAETLSAYLSFGEGNLSIPSEAKLYTFGFDLLLKNGAGVPLSDAAFTLSRTGTTGSTPATYYYHKDAVTRFHTSEPASAITTDEGGKISFTGLAAGTYTLTETAAAAGYDVPANASITITIGADGQLTADGYTPSNETKESLTTISSYPTSIQYGTLTVIRHANTPMPPMTQIPATGGSGTAVFYLAGGLMMLATAALFVLRRKSAA